MMTTETGATADPVHLGDSASSIMNKVQGITGEIPKKQLTVEDLCRMSEPIKRLVEAGRVVAVKRLVEAGRVLAVQEDQDGRRSARITLQDGQITSQRNVQCVLTIMMTISYGLAICRVATHSPGSLPSVLTVLSRMVSCPAPAAVPSTLPQLLLSSQLAMLWRLLLGNSKIFS
nr:uncharacterized protein LOC123768526 [Procambarus clarkii]